MPSFVAIIVGGLGSLVGTLLGGLLIGVVSGLTTVFWPSATEAVIYVMMGLVLLREAARPARRRGEDALNRARALDVAVIAALVTMPYWMAAIGGYTELATRIVVMGLAAMSLNFLLGYTGVLSFGHAAYFGLGAYGAAMAIKYLGFGTLPAIALGVVVATVAAAVIGALIVRRRGVYFAMVTIAFGQVFYFIAFRWNEVTGGDDGLTGWRRLPIDLGFTKLDIEQTTRRSIISCWRCSPSASRRWRC